MLCRFFRQFLLVGLIAIALAQIAFSQSDVMPARKIKVAVKLQYSPLAKQLKLTGNVRVELQIAPDGTVGGHPVLAVEAEKAAMLTEFESGPKESTQIIEFHFGS
jgi:outer membrane biosynthesis protein TonB